MIIKRMNCSELEYKVIVSKMLTLIGKRISSAVCAKPVAAYYTNLISSFSKLSARNLTWRKRPQKMKNMKKRDRNILKNRMLLRIIHISSDDEIEVNSRETNFANN